MATEKPYILPQGQQLTSEIITNLYLYAQPATPTDDELLNSDLIRPILNIQNIPDEAETISDIPQDIELVNAYVDAEPYMASGSGRFANGSQFDLVRRGNLAIYDPVSENQSAGVYNIFDFNADLIRESQLNQPTFFGVIEPVKREAKRLFDIGATKFLYQNKPIVYGTENQDVFVPIDINSITYPFQSDFKSNGYVFIGGEDIDYLPGGFNDDILIGNEGDDVITGDAPFTSLIGGDDTLDGGQDNDNLDGGTGEDVAIFTDDFENYDYSISEDGKIITLNHTKGTQTDGVDTLKNIEFGQFGGNSNYFVDNELADNINFGVVQFSRNATPYFNLTAEEAISTIQSLTTAPVREGTKYNEGLYQGFNFLAQSPKDALNTTNIAYFVADGKSQTNFFDPNDITYHGDAQLLNESGDGNYSGNGDEDQDSFERERNAIINFNRFTICLK